MPVLRLSGLPGFSIALCVVGCGATPPAEEASSSARPGEPASHAPLTSPGRIHCGAIDCDVATQVCCLHDPGEASAEVGSCVAKPLAKDDGTTPWVCPTDARITERSCDEAADCGSGLRCCTAPYDESPLQRQRCGDDCGGELCLAGSTCSHGRRCEAGDGARVGECPLEIAPPDCGGATCRLGERCCWDAASSSGTCGEDCGESAASWFACSGPQHCKAPHACSTWPGATQYRCGGSGFQGGVLCRSLADCPKHLSALGVHPGAPEARACVHTAELPPGVLACVYE